MRFLFLVISVAMLVACSGRPDGASVPRPTAWPRIAADTAMTAVSQAPIAYYAAHEANVTAKPGETFGLDIAYPQYGATVYVTFIPVTDANYRQVLDARLERVRLNLNGAPADNVATDSSLLVTARSTAQIPVQLLARRDGYLVSATAVMIGDAKHMNYDSIRPVYDAITYHLKHSLK